MGAGLGVPPTPATPAPRQPMGGLRREGADCIADRPAEAHSPTAVSKSLGPSSGAVANSLARLAEQGWPELVSSAPRRYRWRGSLPVEEGGGGGVG